MRFDCECKVAINYYTLGRWTGFALVEVVKLVAQLREYADAPLAKWILVVVATTATEGATLLLCVGFPP